MACKGSWENMEDYRCGAVSKRKRRSAEDFAIGDESGNARELVQEQRHWRQHCEARRQQNSDGQKPYRLQVADDLPMSLPDLPRGLDGDDPAADQCQSHAGIANGSVGRRNRDRSYAECKYVDGEQISAQGFP